jgi:hypothetical protein
MKGLLVSGVWNTLGAVVENPEKAYVSRFHRPRCFFAFFSLGVGEKRLKHSEFDALISPTGVSPPKNQRKSETKHTRRRS